MNLLGHFQLLSKDGIIHLLCELLEIKSSDTIRAPSDFTSLHNDLAYYAKKDNVPFYRGANLTFDEDLNPFLNGVLLNTDKHYILASNSPEGLYLLKQLDFKVETYPTSEEVIKYKTLLFPFLKAKQIPVPNFTIGMPLDSGYPCIVKKNRYEDSSDARIVLNSGDFEKNVNQQDGLIIQEVIGAYRSLFVSFKVWTYFYKVIACIMQISKDRMLNGILPAEETKINVPIFPTTKFDLNKFVNCTLDETSYYKKSLKKETLEERHKNMIFEALKQEAIPFQYIPSKRNLIFVDENILELDIIDLAIAVSKVLKACYCMVDIVTDEMNLPYVVNVKINSSYSPYPIHQVIVNNKNFVKLSQFIWYMLKNYYNLFASRDKKK